VLYCKKCVKPNLADEKNLPVNPSSSNPSKPCDCGSNEFEPEVDVLDTWATSSLTPLINSEWEENNEEMFKKIYPMTLRANAHDIISFWDFNTIVLCWLHTKKIPFTDIMVGGHGLDGSGTKMSKSKGNVVSPLEQSDKYSGDAVRWWASSSSLGKDLWFKEEDIKRGLAITTKIWNVTRLIKSFEEKSYPDQEKLEAIDIWIKNKLDAVQAEMITHFDNYAYSKARKRLELFFFEDFCDTYLEIIKWRSGRKATLNHVTQLFERTLLLFAPFLPFVTEKIWRMNHTQSIHLTQWPKLEKTEPVNDAFEKLAKEALVLLRQFKKDNKISYNTEIETLTIFVPKKSLSDFDLIKNDLANTLSIKTLNVIGDENDNCHF